MTEDREQLLERLEQHYRAAGWRISTRDDASVRAVGPGGVEWIGLGVTSADLVNGFAERLATLSRVRMPEGQLCPVDLLPTAASEPDLRAVLRDLGLDRRPHVSVYTAS